MPSAVARPYVADLPGGTATTTVQVQGVQSFKTCFLSVVNAAAGEVEISLAPSPQIGTALPTSDVIARMKVSGTAGNAQAVFPVNFKLNAFENIYIHQTGAGNLGTVSFY